MTSVAEACSVAHIWRYVQRLWQRILDWIRKLLGRENGMDNPEPIEPDPQVGQELRDFFLELLKDGNLRTYRSTGRNDYIGQKRDEGIIGEQAESLLRSGTLAEIEAHIESVTGSGNAVPLFIVCPPM